MNTDLDDARSIVRRTADQAVRTVDPTLTGNDRDTALTIYAIDQARRYREADQFGADHVMTIAWRELAETCSAAPAEAFRDKLEAALAI